MIRPTEPLTPRQMQVAALCADTDLTYEQIGARLGLQPRTIAKIVYRVYGALGVHSRPQLRHAMLAVELAPVGGAR